MEQVMVSPTDYGQKVSGTGIARYEKVTTDDGGDGKWHWIDRQNLDNSCGPTAARMVVKMVTGQNVGQSYFGGLVALSESNTSPSDVSPLSDTAQDGHDFGQSGTMSAHIVTVLKNCKIDSARKLPANTADWVSHWRKCSEKSPGILSMKWGGGAAHFIVMAGPLSTAADKFLILDPWYGIQHMIVAEPTTYRPRQAGSSTGKVLAVGQLQKMAAIVTY
jgi:hypothetical protein